MHSTFTEHFVVVKNCVMCYDVSGDDMETCEILRGLREDNDLTQQQMADFLKIGRTMYRRYETGETEIPVRHLKALCMYYGVSADYILNLPKDQPYGLKNRFG